jgi:biopolymer transport protein ExbD
MKLVKKKKAPPGINTSALPDIVFMLLFFFMVTTVMRETDLKVKLVVPQATEIQKLEKKSLVSYIYIGPPSESFRAKFGTAPRIQLNDAFAVPSPLLDYFCESR